MPGLFYGLLNRSPRISVKRDEYVKVQPNKTIAEVVLRDGFLGIKWVESYQIRFREKVQRKGSDV